MPNLPQLDPEPKAPTCASETCNDDATVRVYWPGQPRAMCGSCALRAVNIGLMMGFRVSVAPLIEGCPF